MKVRARTQHFVAALGALAALLFIAGLAQSAVLDVSNSSEVGFVSFSPEGRGGGAIIPASAGSSCPVPGLSFTVDNETVAYGGSTVLRWQVLDGYPELCTLSGGLSGNREPTGSEGVGPLTSSQTYNISCIAQMDYQDSACYGYAAGTVTVNVNPPNACYPNPDPAGYGTACTSTANACGQTQANGTIQCDGSCSSTPPAVTTPNGVTYGALCQGPVNNCGARSSGAYVCDGTCSATTPPPNNACSLPDLSAGAASPTSAATGQTVTLSAVISNGNTGTGGGFTNSFHIHPSSIPATFAEIYAIRTHTSGTLAANTSGTATAPYAFPSAGTWYVRACADLNASNAGVIQEGDENNNCGVWQPVSVTTVPVTGSCAATHYNCSAGTSVSNAAVADQWTWSCQGSNGGTTASCSEPYNCVGGCGPGPTCNNGSTNPPACDNGAPTATLSANPRVVDRGQSSVLTWNSTNANLCTGTGFSTGNATSGSVSTGALNTAGTQNYQVVCRKGNQNSNPATASVEVLAPGAAISASPPRVPSGNTSTITWSANGVRSCTVTGPGGTIASGAANSSFAFSAGSPHIATITGQSVFTITCQTNSSPVSRFVTVNVNQDVVEF